MIILKTSHLSFWEPVVDCLGILQAGTWPCYARTIYTMEISNTINQGSTAHAGAHVAAHGGCCTCLFLSFSPVGYVLFSYSEPSPKTHSTDISGPAWPVLDVKTQCSFPIRPRFWEYQVLSQLSQTQHDILGLTQSRSLRILLLL